MYVKEGWILAGIPLDGEPPNVLKGAHVSGLCAVLDYRSPCEILCAHVLMGKPVRFLLIVVVLLRNGGPWVRTASN